MIPRETIERVINTARIEEVVGDYVTLHKRGANLIGLCPFHTEKTGSFTVSPSKGIYKCFGCGKSGHAIGFVMEIEKCSYPEAVKQVARKYHIEIEERQLTEQEQQRQDDRESMSAVNEFCNKWFQKQLKETEEGQAIGLAYFHERGLRDDAIEAFQLGYSPEKGNQLAVALKKHGFTEKYILNDPDTKIGVGVCGRSEDGRIYDRFRDRVMFPIFSISGKVVGFAGRIMRNKENTGKYTNSPESIVYSKRRQLYGLYQAKSEISRKDLCYLVEGQMDVISMYQSGIKNVVASGGTALTEEQILLIARLTQNIVVLYDGDKAGIHAALRGIDMFLEKGFNVKVVLLPDGEDPDSYAQSHNASDFIEFIDRHKTDFIRFKIQLLKEQVKNDPAQIAAVVKSVVESVALIPDLITRQVYIKDAADQLTMNEGILTREVVRLRHEKYTELKNEQEKREERERYEKMMSTGGTAQAAGNAQNGGAPAATPAQTAEAGATQAASTQDDKKEWVKRDPMAERLAENYRNLLQLIVRYGELPFYTDENGVIWTVGDYILGNLEGDQIAAPNALYQKMVDEYKANCKKEGFKAEQFFKFHSDMEVSQLGIELLSAPYQLSQIYEQPELQLPNRPQETEEEKGLSIEEKEERRHLADRVRRLLLEIKVTVVEQRLDEVERELKERQNEPDLSQLRPLMELRTQLLNFRNMLCQELNRGIL